MNEGIYYLQLNGKAEGPYTIGQIYDLWAARKINSQTQFARFEELDKWQPLSELTLKISAPRSTASRTPAPELAPAPAPSKAKSVSGIPPAEEYAPSVVYRRGPKPAAPAVDARKILPGIRSAVWNLTFASAICIAVGVSTMFYFLLFFSAPPNTEAIPQALATKQCGVIAGTGLVLMGGILIVARQLTHGLAAFKGESNLRGNPETARQETQTNRP